MKKYCMRCMRSIDKGNICSHCGEIQPQRKLPHLLIPGTILKERYLIGNSLGQGGFGITYIGCDLLLNMRVAIKEYFPNGYANRNVFSSAEVTVSNPQQAEFIETGKDKFLREARVLAEFHDEEGIVDVRDYFKENNTAYIVMEYLDGITLLQCLKRKLIAPDLILEMIAPVMNSLEKIHEKQVIHRDISPDNIMMMRSGKLKLMDFGAARQVDFNDQKSMSVVLKTGFAPVEQYRPRGELGPWTDVYALCATLYMCMTGEHPDNALERVFADTIKWPTDMGIPMSREMEAVLKKGMAVSWKDRYQSIAELRTAFESAAKEPVAVKSVSVEPGKDSAVEYETDHKALPGLVDTVLAQEDEIAAIEQGVVTEGNMLTGGNQEQYAPTIAAFDEKGMLVSDIISEVPVMNKNEPKRKDKPPKEPKAKTTKKQVVAAKSAADSKNPLPMKVKIGIVAAALVILIAVIIGVTAGGEAGSDVAVTAPAHMTMMADAKSVLEDAGVYGIVSALEVTNDTYNEKFGIYKAECLVTVSGQTQTYTVSLVYNQEDDSWELDAQSKLN